MASYVETVQVRTTTIHGTTVTVIAIINDETDEPSAFELTVTNPDGTSLDLTDGNPLHNEPTDREISEHLADLYTRAA